MKFVETIEKSNHAILSASWKLKQYKNKLNSHLGMLSTHSKDKWEMHMWRNVFGAKNIHIGRNTHSKAFTEIITKYFGMALLYMLVGKLQFPPVQINNIFSYNVEN